MHLGLIAFHDFYIVGPLKTSLSKKSVYMCMHATLFMTASLLAAVVYRKNTQIAPPNVRTMN